MSFLLVALGSAVGGVLRYGIGLIALRWLGTGFPYGTLAVNVLGSFLIATVGSFAATHGGRLSEGALTFLVAGLFGGLTTYSAFNEQTLEIARHSGASGGAVYLGVTMIGCLIAGTLGFQAGRLFS